MIQRVSRASPPWVPLPEPVEGNVYGFDPCTEELCRASKLSHEVPLPEPVEGRVCGFDKLSQRRQAQPADNPPPEPVEGDCHLTCLLRDQAEENDGQE
jgi:hypothetical protein